jgi:hypothetical protein
LLRPLLRPEAVALFEAWSELSSDRSMGLTIGPIPFASIDRYAARYGFDAPDDFDLLRRAVRAMDAVYFEYRAQQTAARK